MATIYKDLIGRIDLVGAVGGNDYYLNLPTVTGTALPHSLDNQVIEEVYIICTPGSGNINIYLPSTTVFKGTWNTKIYISQTSAVSLFSVTVYPFPGDLEAGIPADTLNGAQNYTLSGPNEAIYLHQVYDYMWMNLICPAPPIPAPIA